jgi:hypothetical protein
MCARGTPLRPTGRRFADALDDVALHLARVDGVAHRQRKVLSSYLAVVDHCGRVADCHGRFGKIGLEYVALYECCLLGNSFLGRIALGQLDKIGIVLDAKCLGAALRGRDHGAAIS